ncbi:MAG: type II toxin-antitoxin system VapC family toxin [Bacteroidia bacterium]
MAQKKPVICDTNILIEYFKNNPTISEELQLIGQHNIYLCSVTVGELYFGALNKVEREKIKKRILLTTVIPLNEEISDIFEKLIYDYSLSHRLSVPDALIAATVLYYDFDLYTLNLKDFKFIPGLKLYK